MAAQTTKKAKGVEYLVLRDDPDKLTPVVLSLDFLTADTWNTNSYMGINIRPEINIPKYGQINIDYRLAYLDGTAGSSIFVSMEIIAGEGNGVPHPWPRFHGAPSAELECLRRPPWAISKPVLAREIQGSGRETTPSHGG